MINSQHLIHEILRIPLTCLVAFETFNIYVYLALKYVINCQSKILAVNVKL